MCGILGIASQSNITERLLQGLGELEYRGYDSSGIAIINKEIKCCKVKGTVETLQKTINSNPIEGSIGVGHTRWATHGNPSVINAHPHITSKVAVVHNGIIENANELRCFLHNEHNTPYHTDTDTEVITLLITVYLQKSLSPLGAIWQVTKLLKGSFTFAALFKDDEAIIAVKKDSPLLIGYVEGGDIIICSDPKALSSLANNVIYLEDYDCAYIQHNKCLIYDKDRTLTKRDRCTLITHQPSPERGVYPNFMLKEIFDQPNAIQNTLKNFYNKKTAPKISKEITIVACGSSYFAALISKYWLESVAHLTVQLEIASEFIYQNRTSSGTVLFISQSGETADILSGLQHAKLHNNYTISLTNTKGSSVTRISDETLYTEAGNEIGVASTKTFTSQLVALQCLSVAQAQDIDTQEHISNVELLSQHIEKFLEQHDDVHQAADLLSQAKNIMYIGRGTSYGLAMEGALKLKELSYIPTEGIAAGELKHGTLALIDDNVVTVAIIPYNHLFYKTFSNIQEIVARGGKVIALSNETGEKLLSNICQLVIKVPTFNDFFSPILYAIPVQLIAYYTATKVGNNVDRPRNLAKSVTVE